MKLNKVDIGSEIEARINQLGLSKSEFGRKIGIPQQNVNRILEKPSIDTDKLLQICSVLDYNFFALYHDATQHMTVQAINHSAASLSGDAMVLNNGLTTKDTDLAAENAELKRKLIEAQEKIIKLMEERT